MPYIRNVFMLDILQKDSRLKKAELRLRFQTFFKFNKILFQQALHNLKLVFAENFSIDISVACDSTTLGRQVAQVT